MVYGDTCRYPLYIESTINFLRYWLKVRKMPMTRFPKQTLTMLENDIDMYTSTSTSNWAGDIKQCLESYGFQDVWTVGAVNEASFLSLFKRKMVERFQEEWHTKIFNSDRFATYSIYSSHFTEQNNTSTIKKFQDASVRLRFGIDEIKVNKRYESQNIANKNCTRLLAGRNSFLVPLPRLHCHQTKPHCGVY